MTKCSVMLVEDDEEILNIFTSWLIRRGFQVTAATNPREALAAAAINKFDVAVIDMTLPEMNGLELIDQLRLISDFPAIVLSGDDDPKLLKLAMESGVFRYLVKPISMRNIEEVILASQEESSIQTSLQISVANLESIL